MSRTTTVLAAITASSILWTMPIAHGADITIGLIRGINASPVFSMMECGVRKAALERGAKLVVDGPSEWNINLQLPIIRAMIAKKPSFIVFDPNDDTAAAAPIQEAEAQGTKIVLVDNAVKGVNVPYLGMDDVQAGEVAGEALAKAIGGEGTVLPLGTFAANYVPQLRMKGYMAALAKYPKIKVLDKQFAENSADKTSQIIGATLAVHPDLKGLIADGDIVGEFAGATLFNLGRTDIQAFAFDASPAEQTWLQRGSLDGLVAWDPYSLGYEGAKVGFDLLDGKKVPDAFDRQPYVLVTRDNMKLPEMQSHLYTNDCQPKG